MEGERLLFLLHPSKIKTKTEKSKKNWGGRKKQRAGERGGGKMVVEREKRVVVGHWIGVWHAPPNDRWYFRVS